MDSHNGCPGVVSITREPSSYIKESSDSLKGIERGTGSVVQCSEPEKHYLVGSGRIGVGYNCLKRTGANETFTIYLIHSYSKADF